MGLEVSFPVEPLILASASPRRRELLSRLHLTFEVVSADVDETFDGGAFDAVGELSVRKAKAVRESHPGRFILAADTLVARNNIPLGKPSDAEDACRMLRLLSGGTHQVYTGVCVISPEGEIFSGTDAADVTFGDMTDAEIRAYVATGEPLDKAGAYALQGQAALWITGISGSPSCVIGLPLHLTGRLLRKAGYPLL